MNKPTKTPQSSTPKEKRTKPVGYLAENDDMIYSFRTIPVPDAYIEEVARRLLEWVEQDKDAVIFSEFLQKHKIGWTTWDRWKKRSPKLREANEFALMCIGNRREKNGLTRKFDPGMVQRSMPHYSQDWKILTEWYAKTKEDVAQQGTNITVKMEPIPTPEEKKDV